MAHKNVTRLPTAAKRKVRNTRPAVENEGNVEIIHMVSSVDIPPGRVLDRALAADLKDVVVIGTDKDGNFYFASSIAGAEPVVWLLERAKFKLMQIVRDSE